jgi:iron complex transport system ATP-binding protein
MVIDLQGVSITRTGRAGVVTLLDHVDWRVAAGEHWAVLGPNGAGKSTLLNVAGAVIHPSSGTASVLGARLGATDVRALRERIGLVDARVARALRGDLPARAVVLTGAFGSIALQRRRIADEHVQRAHDLLVLIGADRLADRRFSDCSQGERQRILLARALMAEPELLLLDEPATGLDLPSREGLVAALVAMAAERPTLPTVTVTHHLEEIPPSVTHALLLREARVLAAGPATEVLRDGPVSACFDIAVRVDHHGGRWAARVEHG